MRSYSLAEHPYGTLHRFYEINPKTSQYIYIYTTSFCSFSGHISICTRATKRGDVMYIRDSCFPRQRAYQSTRPNNQPINQRRKIKKKGSSQQHQHQRLLNYPKRADLVFVVVHNISAPCTARGLEYPSNSFDRRPSTSPLRPNHTTVLLSRIEQVEIAMYPLKKDRGTKDRELRIEESWRLSARHRSLARFSHAGWLDG